MGKKKQSHIKFIQILSAMSFIPILLMGTSRLREAV